MTQNGAILALESATRACSAALRIDGKIEQCLELGNNIHSQRLLAMCETLLTRSGLAPQDLAAIAVGQGPGSFTGLRIGAGVAQGLAYAAGCPMLGVSSLQALAQAVASDGPVLAGIDARMGQVYWASFDKQGDACTATSEAKVSDPGEITGCAGQILVGNAWHEYQSLLSSEFWEQSTLRADLEFPAAQEVLILGETQFAAGETIAATEFIPHYVRNNVAHKPG